MDNALNKKISAGGLLRFSLPTIISTVFMGIYSSVDGAFVSQLIGTDALSAVNIVMPLLLVSMAVGTMIGTGGSAVIARKMGEGKPQEARENFTLLAIAALAISAFLSLAMLAFLRPLIYALGADSSLYAYCWDYMIPILLLLPTSNFAMIFQVFLIAAGKANFALLFSVLGGLTNIVGDYVLIAIMDFGIAGAAIATGIGYSVPAVIGFFYFAFQRSGSLFFVRPKFDAKVLAKACSNGASEMVTTLSTGVTTLLMNLILMRLAGSDGVAAITIIIYAYTILSSTYMGYSMGIAPIISYNYGRRDSERLQKIYKISLFLIFLTSLATFAISLLFASPMVEIFVPEGSPVHSMAVHGYRLFAVCFLFMGFNGYGSAMFTALSNGKVSAMISFLRTLVFVVVSVLVLPLLLGVNGVWLAIPAAELLSLCVTAHYFRKMKRVYHYA